MKKAFVAVEALLVIIIIGLFAALAVPAYVKVKTNIIAKQLYVGNTVSKEEYEYLQQNISFVNEEYLIKRKRIEVESQPMPEAPTDKIILIVNGKRYKLVAE